MGIPFMRSMIFLPDMIFYLATGTAVDPSSHFLAHPPLKRKFVQPHELKGFVIDEKDGYGVANASVIVKGTKNGVAAKNDGSFAIKVRVGDTLVIASVGFEPENIKIKEKTPKNDLRIILKRAEVRYNGY